MIILEKSELLFSKCLTKNYSVPPPEKNVNPLKRGTSITPPPPPPPPHLYHKHHAPDVFLSFQFPLLKKNDNAQLCRPTGKIRAYIVIIMRTDRV